MMGPERARLPDRLNDGKHVSNVDKDSEVDEDNSREDIETPDKVEYYSNWTTVQRKRAHSEGSLKNKIPLTSEQAHVVQMAAESMTAEQKRNIRRRQDKVRPQRDSSLSSRGEGPSKQKNKGIDPREWGNVNISHESLDIDAQAAALKSFEKQPKRKAKERTHQRREESSADE